MRAHCFVKLNTMSSERQLRRTTKPEAVCQRETSITSSLQLDKYDRRKTRCNSRIRRKSYNSTATSLLLTLVLLLATILVPKSDVGDPSSSGFVWIVHAQERWGSSVPASDVPTAPGPVGGNNEGEDAPATDSSIFDDLYTESQCDLCNGRTIGAPSKIVQDPVRGDRITCAALQARGSIEGFYNVIQCRIIQVSVRELCNCTRTLNFNHTTSTNTNNTATPGPEEATTDGSTTGPENEVTSVPETTEMPTETTIDTVPPTAATTTPSPTASPTDAPTFAPTDTPTFAPTSAEPTSSPTIVSTEPPQPPKPPPRNETEDIATEEPTDGGDSLMPSDVPSSPPSIGVTDEERGDKGENDTVLLQGKIDMVLSKVVGPMTGSMIVSYEEQTTKFFVDSLAAKAATGGGTDLIVVKTDLLSQEFVTDTRRSLSARASLYLSSLGRRHLQAAEISTNETDIQIIDADLRPLRTSIQVIGRQQKGGPATISNDEFATILAQSIMASPNVYVGYLKNGPAALAELYFNDVLTVTAIPYSGTGDVLAPSTLEPVVPPTNPADSSEDGTTASANNGLGISVIVGIVVGSLAAVVLVAGGGYYMYSASTGKGSDLGGAHALPVPSRDEDGNDSLMESAGEYNRGSADAAGGYTGGGMSVSTGTGSLFTSSNVSRLHQSQQQTSIQSKGDAVLPATTGSSGGMYSDDVESQVSGSMMIMETGSQMGASASMMEEMSYTYSLDAGNVGNAGVGGGAGVSMTDGSVSVNDDTRVTRKYTRRVVAPPGRLGIVIDTTLEGPIIHKINAESPLEGILFPGDVIVSIDDVDTRAMSASSITALMARTANQNRVLTVQSDDPNR